MHVRMSWQAIKSMHFPTPLHKLHCTGTSSQLTVVLVQISAAVAKLMVGPPADLVVLGNGHGGVENEAGTAGDLIFRQ